jgi:hypothetical protein
MGVFSAIFAYVLIAFYLLPSIASFRKRNGTKIFWLNLLFG